MLRRVNSMPQVIEPTEPRPAPTTSRAGVAAFDFDGTLAERDTLIPFLARAHGRRRVALALAAQARTYRRDQDAAKADMLRRLVTGDDLERLAALGHDYAVGLHHLLRPEMTERVRWHRSEGHRLVIVSASLGVYLRPLGELLGFDQVIGVELEVDDHGRCTGSMVGGANVRGPEKTRRLTAWLDTQGLTRPDYELWAYGDSSGDDELLALADHARWLGKRAKRNA